MQPEYDSAAIKSGLYGDGIIGLERAFPPEWADALHADIMALFEEAKAVPGGALPRGPQRWYVEVQPERIRGFLDIATHRWFVAVCEAVLGPEYQIVEVGFDVPFPGAADQPWHRDFPAPEETLKGRRLSSLAFNLPAVDCTPEMGALEIALSTHWDDIGGAKDGMFPVPQTWDRYRSRMVRKLPQRGDMSARSALTIHRGTANRSNLARPVLVVGVAAPDAVNTDHHDVPVTRAFLDGLPGQVRDHLTYRVTDRLEPVIQRHVIEGLLEPSYG